MKIVFGIIKIPTTPDLLGLNWLAKNIFHKYIWEFHKYAFALYRKALLKLKKIIMIIHNKRLVGIIITVAILLLIPLIAMQFTSEVNWGLFDFVTAGVLLLGAGLICELILRKVRKTKHRIIFIVAILVMLILIWLELAVGIFGTPFAGS